MGQHGTGAKCTCAHHKFTTVFVILIALTFLLGNLECISAYTVGIVWPSLVAIGGVMRLFGSRCKCCNGNCNCNS